MARIIRLKRKLTQISIIVGLLLVIAFLLSTTPFVGSSNSAYIKSKLPNYFDSLASKLYSSSGNQPSYHDSEDELSKKFQKLSKSKLENDIENKFWLLDTRIGGDKATVQIPYYYNEEYHNEKPPIQPFDPRFTLGIYFNAIKSAAKENGGDTSNIQLPFHWYDWVDLSALNRYLLAPKSEQQGCSLLDARPDEKKMEEEKQIKKAQEAKEKEQSEKSKQQDEQNKKMLAEKKPEANQETNKETDKEANKPQISNDSPKAKRGQADDPKQFCTETRPANSNQIGPGFYVFKSPAKTTPEKAILAGKSFLYSNAPPPSKIIFLTKDGSYNILVDSNSKLLDNGLVEQYLKQKKTSINVLDEFKSLQAKYKPDSLLVRNDYHLSIPEEDFVFNTSEILKQLESQPNHDHLASNYYESLLYSQDKVKNGGPPKYFEEARLLDSLLGDHYDWRFFNGIMYGVNEQTLVLHRLVRTWLSFTRKHDITTWVAHGSLLSWYWNGMAFPWDNDIDVQVPIMHLHKLALHYNQTLIVEDAEDGYGRYFLDCGSFITMREKGNGMNNIDARFIDLDTGLYIDITGLAVSNTKPPDRYHPGEPKEKDKYFEMNRQLQVYNCPNEHFSKLDELSPLIKTSIEGEIGYIPKKYTDILTVEYPSGVREKKFFDKFFLPSIRLWLREKDLYYFLKDPAVWKNYHSYNELLNKGEANLTTHKDYELTETQKAELKKEAKLRGEENAFIDATKTELNDEMKHKIFQLSVDEILTLLHKDEIFQEYYSTNEFTSHHEEELMRLSFGKSTERLMNNAPDFAPMKYDPFLYKMHLDMLTYEEEVDRYLKLVKTYQSQSVFNNDEH